MPSCSTAFGLPRRTSHDLDIGPRDVVALKLTNRVEFIVLLFAAWRIGATITPVNPSLTAGEVARQLDDSGAQLWSTRTTDGLDSLGAYQLDVSDLRTVVEARRPASRTSTQRARTADLYKWHHGCSQGSHARPRQPRRDGRGWGATHFGIDDDRCLLILPLFHVNGIVVSVLMPLLAGASVVVTSRFHPTPSSTSSCRTTDVLQWRPDDLQHARRRFPMTCGPTPRRSDLPCVAPPPPGGAARRFEERYGVPSSRATGSRRRPADRPRTRSTARASRELSACRFPDRSCGSWAPTASEVPQGVDGEVVVAGPNVMRGYLGRPEDTATVLVDGWLRTGDVGHLDDDGYLTLVGRSKEMIIRGGENIYPKEIEDVLTGDPAVLEAAVVGVPDEVWGEVVVAFVEAAPHTVVDLEALEARCAANLSGYKRPIAIHVLDALPRNAVGKVTKPALREQHSAQPSKQKVN